MKLLCFSDLHLTNKNPKFKYGENGVSDLLSDQCQFVSHLVDVYNTTDVDFILFLGDWTDYPTLDPIVQTKSNELLSKLKETDSFLIEGNHCLSGADGKYTVLGASKPFMNTDQQERVVTDDYWQVSYDMGEEGVATFHCFSYRSDYKAIEQRITEVNEKLDKEALNIMLFHFPTTNAVLDNQLQSKKGVALTQDIISNFDVVIGGDFHRPQQLIGTDRAYYVGAPFDFNYGDHVEERGYMMVDVTKEGHSVEMVDNPYRRVVKKVSIEEAFKLTKEELARNIYRVVGDCSDQETLLALGDLQKDAYKLDIGVRREVNFEVDKDTRVIESVDSHMERDLLSNFLSGYERKDSVLNLFDDIRSKCQ